MLLLELSQPVDGRIEMIHSLLLFAPPFASFFVPLIPQLHTMVLVDVELGYHMCSSLSVSTASTSFSNLDDGLLCTACDAALNLTPTIEVKIDLS